MAAISSRSSISNLSPIAPEQRHSHPSVTRELAANAEWTTGGIVE
jgi:hypothetical protein